MDCRVVVEAAVPVFDVETPDEAIRIAISKTVELLNPDLNYVEISMAKRTTPGGEELPPAFIAADEALVALELEMTVFNVEHGEHARRIASSPCSTLNTVISSSSATSASSAAMNAGGSSSPPGVVRLAMLIST